MKKKQQQINVKIDEKTASGNYANLFLGTFSKSEFILDFAKFLPGTPKAQVTSRVITTPQHAKIFFKNLKQHIDNYEKKYGEIEIEQKNNNRPNIGFNQENK